MRRAANVYKDLYDSAALFLLNDRYRFVLRAPKRRATCLKSYDTRISII